LNFLQNQTTLILASLHDFHEELEILDAIKSGQQASHEGHVQSQEAVEKQFASWNSKQSGLIRRLGICLIRDCTAADNPSAAISFGLELFKSTRHLGSFPQSCPVCQETEEGAVHKLLCRGYPIFYQECSGAIEILHVRHGARSEPKF